MPSPIPFRAGALAALLVFAAGDGDGLKLGVPAPTPDGRPARLERAGESSCAKCHAEILEQWASTAHALAWVDELYQTELAGRKKVESCWGCHVPEPLQLAPAGARPDARADARHFGVACVSSTPEASSSVARSSRSRPISPGTRWPARLATSTIVLLDAARTLSPKAWARNAGSRGVCNAWLRTTRVPAPAGTSRQGAMWQPTQLRPVAAAPLDSKSLASPITGPTVVRWQVAHSALLPAPTKLSARAEACASVGAPVGPSCAPPGPRWQLSHATLQLDTGAYLPVAESLEIELPGIGTKVRVVGVHHDPRLKDPVRFLETELALEKPR